MLSKQYIEEHQVLERYLSEQLSDQERDEFENYYAENPGVLHDLEAIAHIKLGAAILRESGELRVLTSARPTPRWRMGLALAASLLIAVLAGSYWMRSVTGQAVILAGNLADFDSTLSVAAAYQVQRTRSDVDAVIKLPAAPQAIKLRIRPMFESPPMSFRVELSSIAANSEERTAVASAGKLELDGEGFITVYLDSHHLRPGNYELEVGADAAAPNRATNEFLIEVAPASSDRQ